MPIGIVPLPPSRQEIRQIKYNEYVKNKELNNETDIMKYDDWAFVDTYWGNNEKFDLGITQKPLRGCGDNPNNDPRLIELSKEIKVVVEKYHNGDATKSDVKELIEKCYQQVKVVNTEKFYTSGTDKDDNMRMLERVISCFQTDQASYTGNQNFLEGKELSGGKDQNYWEYYNASYYYKEKEMSEFLFSVGKEIAESEDLGDFTQAVQPPNDTFFRQKFNSSCGCSMIDTSFEPPKGFVYFQDHNSDTINISGVTFNAISLSLSEAELSSIPDSYKRFLTNIKGVLPSFIEQLMKSVKDDTPNLYQSKKIQSAYDMYLNYKYF